MILLHMPRLFYIYGSRVTVMFDILSIVSYFMGAIILPFVSLAVSMTLQIVLLGRYKSFWANKIIYIG